MIIKLLSRIPSCHRAMLRLAFDKQSKPRGFEGMSQVFIDSNGLRYYKHDNDLDIPLERLSRLQVCMMELNACLSSSELDMFLDAIELALNETIRPPAAAKQAGRRQPGGLARIGHITSEMRLRRQKLIHEDILFSLAAILYIREDEDPARVDNEIEAQKLEQFRKDAAGGLHSFFMQGGLRPYLPYADMSEEEFMSYLERSRTSLQAMKQTVEEYIIVQRSSAS